MTAFRPVPPSHRPSSRRDSAAPGPASASLDDATLLAAVRMGDPTVADALCRRVWPAVDRTVRRLLRRNDSEREDVTQLALIEIVRAIAGYRGESTLDTWVSAVTARVVYKQIRRRPFANHLSLDTIDEAALGHPGAASGERTIAARELLARVIGHFDRAGEKLAWAFVLHDVLGYGLRDAAHIMGVSEAAAQSRLFRGRRRIHDSIAADQELADLLQRLPALNDNR